mmetsp:Transcript_13475/g.15438  ORF Transcript_13475/g.15438 Transcript_13475/m.15438 type:complete len:102 (+) Transcript_13475:76-381(+)
MTKSERADKNRPTAQPSSSSSSGSNHSGRWLSVTLGLVSLAAVGALWYTTYTANRSTLVEQQIEAKRLQTLRALSEVPGRRFSVGGSYESQRKDALANLGN